VSTTRFTTSSVEPPHQLEFWRHSIEEVYVRLEIGLQQPGNGAFDGTIVRYMDHGLAYSEIFGDAHIAVRTQPLAKRFGDDVFMLLVQRTGRTLVEQDGRQTVLNEGEFTLCYSGRACVLTMPCAFHHEAILFEGRAMRAALPDSDRFIARAMRGDTGPGRVLVSLLGAVRENINDLDEHSGAHMSDALLGMVSANAASLRAGADHAPTNHLETYHRERVRALVAERLFDPELSVEAIADRVKLSSRYLYRLFEEEPETLSTSIWRQRLEAARLEILSPSQGRRSLTDIAYSVGFKDSAHFSRMFKATYGASPREFKQSLAGCVTRA
jgi:AraC-like DNA-binding protein